MPMEDLKHRRFNFVLFVEPLQSNLSFAKDCSLLPLIRQYFLSFPWYSRNLRLAISAPIEPKVPMDSEKAPFISLSSRKSTSLLEKNLPRSLERLSKATGAECFVEISSCVASNIEPVPGSVAWDKLRLIGQADQKFIICQYLHHFFFFDQHAIHERIRLESFAAQFYGPIRTSECCVALGSSFENYNTNLLQKFGFKVVSRRGRETNYYLESVPAVIADNSHFFTTEKLLTLVSSLSLKYDCTAGRIPYELLEELKSLACHGAIKFGKPLSRDMMCDLLGQLKECKFPFICAHGRRSLVSVLLT